jgi:ABC-type transport system substrate-binding protein
MAVCPWGPRLSRRSRARRSRGGSRPRFASFPARLALPYFCAVPLSTPVVVNGVPIPIPSAGPYYVAAYLPGQVAALMRNPNYSGRRPHYFDAIVYHFRISPGAA